MFAGCEIVIDAIAQARYAATKQRAVKLIAVNDEKIPPIGCFMNKTVFDLDVPAARVAKARHE